MLYDKYGTLVVDITSAGGALPARGALVRVYGADEANGGVLYSVISDWDGIATFEMLPTPSKELSQTPGAVEQPYALYTVTVYLNGYYTVRVSNIAVFENEITIQPINLIPLPLHTANVSYPRGNLNIVSRENEMLE